jgi:Atrophied bacterial Ig domain
MGYSNNELDNTYESLINSASSEAQIWNASTVYFDDEIVEYQGKYYIALKKTSAEVPGRSKHGIWKELIEEEEDVNLDLDLSLYGEEPQSPKPLVKEKNSVEIAAEKAQKVQQRSTAVKKIVAPVLKKEAITPIPPTKTVNKPLARKKTLKERQVEVPHKTEPLSPSTERKMHVAPSDQSVVNDILKAIEFKKIKGLNTDDLSITTNLILPQKMGDEIQLIWESSHPHIISAQGAVTRPDDGVDIAVNLSVNVTKKQTSAKRFFTLWVKANERVYSDDECVNMVYDILDFEQIRGKNERLTEITHSLELLTHGLHDTEILWASKERDLLDERGHFYRERLRKNTRIRIYAIIVKGNVQRLKHFELTLKTV